VVHFISAIVYGLERIVGQALDVEIGAQELAHSFSTIVPFADINSIHA
jgi:hypothetical protein